MTDLLAHGRSKYRTAELLHSSAACEWADVAAELRQHVPVVLPPLELRQMEVCIATRAGPKTVVTRKAEGLWQETVCEPGMIWLCPVGVREDEVTIQGPLELLHLYLPASRFTALAELTGGAVDARAVDYAAGAHDALIRQIGASFLGEMKTESSSGRVLIEALAIALTARLAQGYSHHASQRAASVHSPHGLDDARLTRVLEFMRSHLEDEIGIEDLAAVACLSPFHFTRMFRVRMGQPPHRYLSALRLERAKTLLALSDMSLAEIALASCFSTQANFHRAFRRATGATPGEYRRGAR